MGLGEVGMGSGCKYKSKLLMDTLEGSKEPGDRPEKEKSEMVEDLSDMFLLKKIKKIESL